MAKYNPCSMCGRKAKRYCPALEKDICSYCCASKRNSSIECLPECSHNLFGITNYARWLEFEKKWDYKFADEYIKTNQKKLIEAIRLCESDNLEQDQIMNIAIHLATCYICDENGKSYIDTFIDEFANELGNDGKLYINCLRSARPAILEVKKVINHNSTKCINLLDPDCEPIIIVDNHFVKVADKFGKYLVWMFDLPYFSRLISFVFELMPNIYEHFISSIEEIKDQLNEKNITDTIAMHYGEVIDSLFIIHDLKRRHFIKSMSNMDIKDCAIRYSFSCSQEQIEQIMEAKPDFEFDDIDPEPNDPENTQNYIWLRKGESKKFDDEGSHITPVFGVGILANVKLMPGILEIKTMSAAKKDFAKKMAEKFFGDLITFDKELVVDIAKQAANESEEWPPESNTRKAETITSPLSPEEEEKFLIQFYEKHYQKFLDDKIPAIDDMTPREAMNDPDMRPRLIELMKGHVRNIDSTAKKKGINLNIDWVLEELGLDELL